MLHRSVTKVNACNKIGNNGINANIVFLGLFVLGACIYLQFSSIFGPHDVRKCDVRCQSVDFRLNFMVTDIIGFIGIAKMRLAILAFLYFGEFVKMSMGHTNVNTTAVWETNATRLQIFICMVGLRCAVEHNVENYSRL